MKTLLINGCSFAERWRPTEEFVKSLDCDTVTNISKVATSFQRTCRSTIEWIAQNHNPHFVIIPITFVHRWELSLSKVQDEIDGNWFPLQIKDLLLMSKNELAQEVDVHKIGQMMDIYYGYGSKNTLRTWWDKTFTEIILLSSFLKQRNIKHLMFDMCNAFDKTQIKGDKGFEKIKLIDENPNVIDLWSFCGNRLMWETLSSEIQEKTDQNTHHHHGKDYSHLENHIIGYLETNLQ